MTTSRKSGKSTTSTAVLPDSRGIASRLSRSTQILVVLWGATAIAVLGAHFMRPPAAIALSLDADNVGFTASSKPFLLASLAVESLRIASFDSIEVGTPPSTLSTMTPSDPASASLTMGPAKLEALTAPAGARIVVNWNAEESDSVTLAIARQPVEGTAKMAPGSKITCYGCGGVGVSKTISGVEFVKWKAGAGATIMLGRRADGKLDLSEGAIDVEDDLDTSVLAGGQRLPSIKGEKGKMTFLDTGRTEIVSPRSGLLVGGIRPDRGRLKTLTIGPAGLHVELEATVGYAGVLEAGRVRNLLPSWLELGFHYQPWLYIANATLLVGGLLAKVAASLRQGKDA